MAVELGRTWCVRNKPPTIKTQTIIASRSAEGKHEQHTFPAFSNIRVFQFG